LSTIINLFHQILVLIEKKTYLRSKIFKTFSILLTVYTFLIFPFSPSKNLNHLNKNLWKDFDIESNRTFPENQTDSQRLLETKLYSDFFNHQILSGRDSSLNLKLLVTNEGKICGCKNNRVYSINYWDAKQSKQLIKKTNIAIQLDHKLTIFSLNFLLN